MTTTKQKQINCIIAKSSNNFTSHNMVYLQYGKIIKIPVLFLIVLIICLVTPFTNFFIGIAYKKLINKTINFDIATRLYQKRF